jgi:DNA mismatch endonuclease, patch repair protein
LLRQSRWKCLSRLDEPVADVFSKEKRSWVMSRIHGVNTGPEKIVRSFLHMRGLRFRLHVSGLPGKPDIVLPRHRTVVFVHGCFWHGHRLCRKGRNMPETNARFWKGKISGNMARDKAVNRRLRRLGWNVITVWECKAATTDALVRTFSSLLESKAR